MRCFRRLSCAALFGVLSLAGAIGCMNHSVSTRVTAVTTDSRMDSAAAPAVLAATLEQRDAAVEVMVTRRAWCQVHELVRVHREQVETSEASGGRWGGVIPLALIGVGAGLAASEAQEDQQEMLGGAVLYCTGAFLVYYLPLAAEYERRTPLAPLETTKPARMQPCGPAEPFAGARVELRLDSGERRTSATDARGRARFDGIDVERIRHVIVEGSVVLTNRGPVSKRF
ncbi:MAG: hypothetical protein ACOC1F_11585 [Myxococcota bacterium]